MSKPRHAAALVAAVFLAVVAVVVGATVAVGLRAHNPQAPAAAHAPINPVAAIPLSHDPAPGSMASRIPDTSIASSNEALHTAPGVLVARGDHFTIEKVALPKALKVDVRGTSSVAHSVYRITITAGPYQMRDMPAIVSLGNRPLSLGVESTDLASLMAFTFDPSVLTNGATLKVSYGLPSQVTTVWSSAIEVVK